MPLVQNQAPDFKADAVVNGEFKTLRLSDFRGKWVYLFFYPLDFTFVCPTEIIAFSDAVERFQALGTQVLGCSIDSKYVHLRWTQTPRSDGGLGGCRYPLLEDLNKEIARAYGADVFATGSAAGALDTGLTAWLSMVPHPSKATGSSDPAALYHFTEAAAF